MKVGIAITNYFFDIEDYNDPIKLDYSNDYEVWLAGSMNKNIEIKYKNNEVTDSSSYIPLIGSENYSFYSIGDQIVDFSNVDSTGEIINIKITLDSKYSVIQRKVYSFSDLVGQIGGINQIWVVFGVIISSIFVSKAFMESLLSRFYKVSNKSISCELNSKILPSDTIR